MGRTAKGEETKNKIIKCSGELFFKNGYNATGISEILKAAEIPKGSFYFYFDSKKSVAEAVAVYYEKKLTEWIIEYYSKYGGSEFIEKFIGSMIEKAQSGKYYGCPLTTIGQELAFFEPDIAEVYNKSLKKLIILFESVFRKNGRSNEDSKAMGKKAFVMYEGFLVYYRISKNINVLYDMKKEMTQLFKQQKKFLRS